ncbi:energy conserving hydrogenase EhbF [Methanobrevibacter filiformis]|uniref:Na(+)/H(+) antiporter subunit D n=1 Tax=Methanobrevibacter filiformis TaxID=55758 RepID=A0A166C0B3_9EURY|nr:energy conserving hydrogenase EhbF [Methanobrevibacter filiformis]KZX13998.1 Na(+)/H(+) antiporter subunit D [Methanobrevibacter filiformis]
MIDLIPLMVIIPIICALLLNILHGKNKTVKYFAIIVAIVVPIIPLLANYGLHYFGGHVPLIENSGLLSSLPSYISQTPIANFHLAITYSFESLQKIFIFFFGIVAFLAVFTSFNEMKRSSGAYGFLMFMGIAAVIAMLLSDDIFHMYIFFEIAALVQVGIVLASNTEDNYEAALKYLILGSIGGPILLIGIGFLLGMVGSVNITDIVFAVKNNLVNPLSSVFLLSFILIFFGWLYSAGLPPFHTIKSSIYSKALPSGGALLQAFSVMVFVSFGIAILRIFSVIPYSKILIIVFSALAMILSITMAITQTDFRRILGFLAVGELGYIGLGFGIGTQLSVTAGLFQALNEIIITALLFIGFGTIYYLTKVSDIRKLGGLIGVYPKTAIMILIGGLAMAGVPPLNVFQSKLMLIQSALKAGIPELAIFMIIMSIVTFMTFTKVFHSLYLKPKPRDLELAEEGIPKSATISIAVLLIISIVLGVLFKFITTPIFNFVGGIL